MDRDLSEPVADRFSEVVAVADAPMFIVTTVTHTGHRSGCLVGFATQCSIDPPRFLACLSVENHTYRAAGEADLLAVHVLPADRHDLAEWFGGTTGDEVDTFAAVAWRPGPGGIPLVEGCPDWFVGRILERVALGDHVGFLLDPIAAAVPAAEAEVAHLQDVADVDPGHEP